MVILLLFWYGPYAAVVTKIETDSMNQCESMSAQIMKQERRISGSFRTMCVKK